MNELIFMVVCATGITANIISMMIIFPRKKSLAFTITMFAAVSAALSGFLTFTHTWGEFGGAMCIVYIPLFIFLFRGLLFQKLFAFFMLVLLAIWQLRLGIALAQIFAPRGSDDYSRLLFCIVMPFYIAYTVLIYLFGRKLFGKLFVHGRTIEWVLYTIGVMLSFFVMIRLQPVPNMPLYLLLMFFIMWGFFILCFAIINTHDKSKQKYELSLAQNALSAGREHYQKMNELYDTIRILRHDYKFHLNAASQLMRSGSKEDIENYLKSVEVQLSEKELPKFCENPVVNALLASYAERCAKLDIALTIDAPLPEKLSIDNYELCIICGNILENAVEACMKLKTARRIELYVKVTDGNQLVAYGQNSCADDSVLWIEDGQLVSAKQDGGYGLQSIQAVAKRHNGNMQTERDKDKFMTYVRLNL